MKKIILFVCCFCVSSFSFAQTETVFSQQINNFGMINPSYFNINPSLSAGLYYRNQWSGFEGAPQSVAFYGHGKLSKTNLGLGLSGTFEEIGHRKNTFVGVISDYGVRLSESSQLMFGVKLGVEMKRYSFSDAYLGGESEGDYVGDDFNKNYFTASYGLTWQYRKLNVGVAHSLTLRDKEEGNASVFTAHAEYDCAINDRWSVRPLALYMNSSEWDDFFEFGAMGHFRKLAGLGVTYRVDRNVTLLGEVALLPYLSVAYSYDMNVGELSNISNGSHEIGLRFNAESLYRGRRTKGNE